LLLALSLPVLHLHTAMPNASVLTGDAGARIGSERLQQGFGPGAPSQLQIVAPAATVDRAEVALRRDHGVAAVSPPQRSGALALIRLQPKSGDAGGLIQRLREQLPAGSRVGGAAAEAHDLEHALGSRTPLVYALVLTVGFILLLAVVRAPLAAGAAVLLNLLATAAAFGVATLIFQDGIGETLLGFKSQGFVDAWAPVFFFCLSFALAMDYTVFLLTSVRDEFDRTGSAREALVEGLARSGRVINAAGAVMIVVFFTFGLSHPLPPKEMGVILGVAVLLDTMLVRLLLLPVVLRLLGERAWWIPSQLDRWLPAIRLRHDGPQTSSARHLGDTEPRESLAGPPLV
jgi:RND superfamily putative drug exporter